MSNSGLDVRDLVVIRAGRRVVDGLSLSVAPGEIYALLGGNGTGKSTTLFAALGLLARAGGTIEVDGKDPGAVPDAVRRVAAYLPENVALYDHLTAVENVRYFLDLSGEKRSSAELNEAFDAVKLDPGARNRRVGGFSKGMRQKTAIALSLLRRTPVLLLDEPTSGLDPSAAQDFHDLILDLRSRNVAVLMVTHDLFGAADTADKIGVLRDGRIAQEWSAQEGPQRFDVQALHRGYAGVGTA
ncbi:ABC transporter ATP-binding protein [Brevundimonas sp.]|jgi:ABC-2 type transport system ATP-binding protein|uniref:ABC transporter ATP-binding protein n=1 Tax=Brevundimonas sp. TaxID=1871086 RepID=UPI0039192F27|nr:ABC transporter ATP-binding protein [Brevundimonas sp.]